MKKTIIILTVLVGVVLLVLGLASKKQSTQDEKTDLASTEKEVTGFDTFVMGGDPYECTVTQNIDMEGFQNSVVGTVFMYGGMIRGDYAVEAQGMNIETSLVVRDGFVYSWNSLAPVGVKAAAVSDEEGDDDTSVTGNISWNTDKIGEYECKKWNLETSKFEIPTDITFQEI